MYFDNIPIIYINIKLQLLLHVCHVYIEHVHVYTYICTTCTCMIHNILVLYVRSKEVIKSHCNCIILASSLTLLCTTTIAPLFSSLLCYTYTCTYIYIICTHTCRLLKSFIKQYKYYKKIYSNIELIM